MIIINKTTIVSFAFCSALSCFGTMPNNSNLVPENPVLKNLLSATKTLGLKNDGSNSLATSANSSAASSCESSFSDDDSQNPVVTGVLQPNGEDLSLDGQFLDVGSDHQLGQDSQEEEKPLTQTREEEKKEDITPSDGGFPLLSGDLSYIQSESEGDQQNSGTRKKTPPERPYEGEHPCFRKAPTNADTEELLKKNAELTEKLKEVEILISLFLTQIRDAQVRNSFASCFCKYSQDCSNHLAEKMKQQTATKNRARQRQEDKDKLLHAEADKAEAEAHYAKLILRKAQEEREKEAPDFSSLKRGSEESSVDSPRRLEDLIPNAISEILDKTCKLKVSQQKVIMNTLSSEGMSLEELKLVKEFLERFKRRECVKAKIREFQEAINKMEGK